MTVGDPVERTKQPLSVELGPGILDQIFDGIQRPLQVIAEYSKSIFVPKGVDVPSLNPTKLWEYKPISSIKEGDILSQGDIFASVVRFMKSSTESPDENRADFAVGRT